VKRLLPRSLVGQMALLIGVALFVAQLANFALILNERQKLGLAQSRDPAITRFVGVASDFAQAAPEFRSAVLEDASRRGARFTTNPAPTLPRDAQREPAIERQLAIALAAAGLRGETRATIIMAQREPREIRRLVMTAQLPDGTWLGGRVTLPRGDPWLSGRLLAATLLLYLIVLGVTLLIARRLARPLRDLTLAAEGFGGRTEPRSVEARGPADLRQAIDAFNAMNRRVVTLLDEKDRMLGAIGHDLRTPLASLRLRAEGMEDDVERDKMVATIAEMTTMLEDILVLAHSGRAREEVRPVDMSALVDALIEEYRELGRPVTFEPGARQVAPVQPNLIRRALRNLVDNALAYGRSARISVESDGDCLLVAVRDEGPGIPADQIDKVVEPFYRGEQSRSRTTGGTGLGLAIARTVAESHGGDLRLANHPDGGLVATLVLPSATRL
jgi:signal transduction histidine kinase